MSDPVDTSLIDRARAIARGLLTPCDALLIEPVTVSGTYRCDAGHAHVVTWHHGYAHVSPEGLDWAFLAALDAASDAAVAVEDPGTPAYEAASRATLAARGYEDVLASQEGGA